MAKREKIFLDDANPRDVAVNCLVRFERAGEYIQDGLHRIFAEGKLSPRDKRQAMELAYGTCRQMISLDYLTARHSRRPMRRIDLFILSIIRVGLYQLIYQAGTPDYAAVGEAVEQAKKTKIRGADGFVNAILRSVQGDIVEKGLPQDSADRRASLPIGDGRICRFKTRFLPDPVKQPSKYLSAAYAHPPWLMERWLKRYGIETLEQICEANNARPALTLRPNRLRGGESELSSRFSASGIRFIRVGEAFQILDPAIPEQLPGYEEGLFSVQDLTAMAVAPLANPQPGQRILDLCAAPGGKTSHLAELMSNNGQIVACDVNAERLSLVEQNSRRLRISIVRTCSIEALDKCLAEEGLFDAVIADVPCSNTGVFARRVEARHRFKPTAIQQLVQHQRELLQAACRAVNVGGRIVYSTCSVEPAEDEDLIEKFLKDNPKFELIEQRLTLPQCNPPQTDEEDLSTPIWHDGGYTAVILRRPAGYK
jgi:16S rRNA (cytosine967-C5)-methyltransferase